MDALIRDLHISAVDKFINPAMDTYARIIRRETELNPTVDLQITVNCIAVNSTHIIIEFPDLSVLAVNINSVHYLKIEVM